ncbi:jg16670 [Pararge aegeria aegeria]|uniref:Jg16670 protein n=1 Tax=Pararge aegeria aegeria TaxID=348720 RepID=A0A8S4RC47_9NEOP|nr:jg16670 [Pararge aegeria aegeria]
MGLLKKSVEELAVTFTARMDEFQREVRTSIFAASPSSNISSQFSVFRSFVMTALENLQLQLQLDSRHGKLGKL